MDKKDINSNLYFEEKYAREVVQMARNDCDVPCHPKTNFCRYLEENL